MIPLFSLVSKKNFIYHDKAINVIHEEDKIYKINKWMYIFSSRQLNNLNETKKSDTIFTMHYYKQRPFNILFMIRRSTLNTKKNVVHVFTLPLVLFNIHSFNIKIQISRPWKFCFLCVCKYLTYVPTIGQ